MDVSVRVDILEMAVRPDVGDLALDHARYVLALDLPERVKDRADELGMKAQGGSLTESERQELDDLLAVNSFLSLLKIKAKQTLRGIGGA